MPPSIPHGSWYFEAERWLLPSMKGLPSTMAPLLRSLEAPTNLSILFNAPGWYEKFAQERVHASDSSGSSRGVILAAMAAVVARGQLEWRELSPSCLRICGIAISWLLYLMNGKPLCWMVLLDCFLVSSQEVSMHAVDGEHAAAHRVLSLWRGSEP